MKDPWIRTPMPGDVKSDGRIAKEYGWIVGPKETAGLTDWVVEQVKIANPHVEFAIEPHRVEGPNEELAWYALAWLRAGEDLRMVRRPEEISAEPRKVAAV